MTRRLSSRSARISSSSASKPGGRSRHRGAAAAGPRRAPSASGRPRSGAAAPAPRRAGEQRRQRGGVRRERRGGGRSPRPREAVAQAGQVARTAALEAEPRHGAGEIGRGAQLPRRRAAQRRVRRPGPRPHPAALAIAASRSAGRQPLGEEAAPAAVTVRSIASSRLPARSPARVRVSSRLARVAGSIAMCAGRLAAGRLERRPCGRPACARHRRRAAAAPDLGPREGAEAVERRDAEIGGEPALGAGRVEDVAADGVTAARASRQSAASAGSAWSASATRISLGSMRAISAGEAGLVASRSTRNAPVEMSTQARP